MEQDLLYPSGAPAFTPCFSDTYVAPSLPFFVVFELLSFLFLLAIALSVLRYTILITPLISSSFSHNGRILTENVCPRGLTHMF